jgi:signal recognition particle receptor subunit beta
LSEVVEEPPEELLPDADEIDDLSALEDEDMAVDANDDLVVLGGDASLEIGEVDEIAAQLGATIVLIAGPEESGKTSLLVALYDQFLVGEFADFSFSESRTLDAFDSRQFGSRIDSHNDHPDMKRTAEREMRFLHLRLVDEDERLLDLFATDIWGEVFEELAVGTDVSDNIPIAPRIDRTLILIDGAAVADKTKRQGLERRMMMMIGALLDENGLKRKAPILIALSKSDLVKGANLQWYRSAVKRLVKSAQDHGAERVDTAEFAAVPSDGADARGLEQVLQWMLDDAPTGDLVTPTRQVVSERVFLSASAIGSP